MTVRRCGRPAPAGQACYDHDPEALAWARAHVRAAAARYVGSRYTKKENGRFVAAVMERLLVSGGEDADGSQIIGAFDARKPAMSAEVARREASR